MEQIKQEVPEKNESKHRDKLKFIAHFGTVGPSGFCCIEKIDIIST